MLPNHYHSVSILYSQYGHLLSDNATAVNALFVMFIIGIGIGMFVGVKTYLRKDDSKKELK